MIISYEGTRYLGWQKQAGQCSDRTIQGKLENVLSKLTGQEVQVIGSGRTDAGVHALAQTVNVHLDIQMTSEQLKDYLNQYLPEDIGVSSVKIASDRFHSRLNALEKIYCYRIYLGEGKPVFLRKYVWELAQIKKSLGLGERALPAHDYPLDLSAMQQAASLMVGPHDFAAFCANRRMKKSTVRSVSEITFNRIGLEELHILFTGNGFLHHMVRIMTGTLLEVGLGIREADSINQLIQSKKRELAGTTAAAKGLTLMEVRY